MTGRLIAIAVESEKQIDGWAVAHNMPDLEDIPLRRLCNFIWWFVTRNAEKQADVDKFERRLWMPPPGEVGMGPWAAEAEQAGLLSLKKGLAK